MSSPSPHSLAGFRERLNRKARASPRAPPNPETVRANQVYGVEAVPCIEHGRCYYVTCLCCVGRGLGLYFAEEMEGGVSLNGIWFI